MAHLEAISNSDLNGTGTYDTLPQHPRFFGLTPRQIQPREFMYNILMRKTAAASRDETRQQRLADNAFRKHRRTEKDDERKATIAELNPDVDRGPARRGSVDESKSTITLFMPEGQGHILREFKYQASVDWASKKSIADLNSWRNSIFNNRLPPTYRRGTKFHDEEDQWLRDNAIGIKEAHGSWHDVVARFNSHFEGRVLAGQTTPRPARRYHQLKSRRQWLLNGGAAVRRQTKPRNRTTKSTRRHTAVDLPVEDCD